MNPDKERFIEHAGGDETELATALEYVKTGLESGELDSGDALERLQRIIDEFGTPNE